MFVKSYICITLEINIINMSENSIDIVWKDQFDQLVSSSDKLLLVDFWAEWCGPCRMLGPVLHDIVDKYPDTVQLLKVNVDESSNRDIAMQFGVRSIPQVSIFKWGEQVDQFIGALPPDQVEAFITKHTAE